MTIFTISYDLKRPHKDYKVMWDEMDRLGAQKVLASVYLANLNLTTEQVRDYFQQYILDDNDMLIVAKTTEFKYVRAIQGTGNWLASNL